MGLFLILFVGLVGANLLFQNNRALLILLCVLLWVLVAYSGELADTFYYQQHFLNVDSLGDKGSGYGLLVGLFNASGLGYNGFKVFAATVLVGVRLTCALTLTRRPGLVMALYAVFPFCLDAVQLRYSFGISIALIGYLCLKLWTTAEPKKIAVFIALSAASASVHIGVVVFSAILALMHYCSLKWVRRTLPILILAILLVSMSSQLTGLLDSLGFGMRYRTWSWEGDGLFRSVVRAVVISSLVLVYSFQGMRTIKKGELRSNYEEGEKLGLLMFSTIPLMGLSIDFCRIPYELLFIADVCLADTVSDGITIQRESDHNIFRTGAILLVSLATLSIVILISVNYYDVWVPLFEQNTLI